MGFEAFSRGVAISPEQTILPGNGMITTAPMGVALGLPQYAGSRTVTAGLRTCGRSTCADTASFEVLMKRVTHGAMHGARPVDDPSLGVSATGPLMRMPACRACSARR